MRYEHTDELLSDGKAVGIRFQSIRHRGGGHKLRAHPTILDLSAILELMWAMTFDPERQLPEKDVKGIIGDIVDHGGTLI